jgi:hypothetical protein
MEDLEKCRKVQLAKEGNLEAFTELIEESKLRLYKIRNINFKK